MLSDFSSLQGILQGLVTISIGAIVGIKVFQLNIKISNTVSINGNDNIALFITNNFYRNNHYQLSFTFRFVLLMLLTACTLFTWLPKFLLVEIMMICVPLIGISFIGMFASPYGKIAIIYFIATLLISWSIWRNYELMGFVVKWAPELHPTWSDFTSAGNRSGNILGYVGYFVSTIAAIYGLSWLVLLQIQTAFSFLVNRGRFDEAVRFSVTNFVISLAMILLVTGIIAALLAPNLLWSDAQNGTPGYNLLLLLQPVLYNVLPIEALQP